MTQWQNMVNIGRFSTKTMYLSLVQHLPKVMWKDLVCGNRARPRTVFILWLACNNRLATKDRLAKFGRIVDCECAFCSSGESVEHLFFCCNYTKGIWEEVLKWLKVRHAPLGWKEEVTWLVKICKSKNCRAQIMKMAIAETIYEIWWDRNMIVHNRENRDRNISKKVIDNIVYRMWGYPKYRGLIAQMLMP
ncbi:uncharacterized protein LOC131614805 [Vicia villosa]|uniref:uncharacterized protein LOC131614805 n=1 Tax=Vicia villosa TaxID=3911 RepID=UPI00273AE8EA|nr:uncharacterized protein LOC131614805 [Vicia villosa]